ncbi:MAG: hypothetical protein Q4G69_08700 [Planctomycetia bacterium]|nr:hypothetical protein [Planctomycetia bacterium]
MRYTNILARFLSLLDVAIMLVGLFVVLLALARFQDEQKKIDAAEKEQKDRIERMESASMVNTVLENSKMPIIMIEGDCRDQNGQCFLLNKDYTRGREIAANHRGDIEDLIPSGSNQIPVVFFITKEGAWDTAWTDEKFANMEKTWKCKIVRVLNFRFPEPLKQGAKDK